MSSLVGGTGIAPGGIWFTRYDKPASERAEDVTVAWGRGAQLEVIRPLKAGGAHRFLYDDFTLTSIATVSEDAYKAEKEKIKHALAAHSPEAIFGN
jgi:hypothetical protein